MSLRLVLLSLLWLLIPLGCASAPAGSVTTAPGAPPAVLDPVSSPAWATDMARFAAEDAAHPPPAHPIVFTGSSSVRMWQSLPADFPGLPVLNRGFGGSQVRDAVHYLDQVALGYRPRRIVLYAGDNDIDAGRSGAQVRADVLAFVQQARRAIPGVPIVYLSIKPSLARIDQLPRQQAANALIRAAVARLDDVTFVDVATPMLDARGRPRPELFLDDGLHMTPAGYAIWTRVLAPALR